MWNLLEALDLIRHLEPIAQKHGLHVALGGSVLPCGSSRKDVDILVLPHKTKEPYSFEDFRKEVAREWLHATLRHPEDEKEVWVAQKFIAPCGRRKRVDFFFLK